MLQISQKRLSQINEATRLLTQAIPDIDADHIALCTNKKLDDLVNLLAFEKPLSYLKNKARMHKRDIARRESLVFYYAQQTTLSRTRNILSQPSHQKMFNLSILKVGRTKSKKTSYLKNYISTFQR